MYRNMGTIFIFLGVAFLGMSLVPWLECVLAWPQNAADLIAAFPNLATPMNPTGAFKEGADVCWDAFPAHRERGNLGLGLANIAAGVIARFMNNIENNTSGDDIPAASNSPSTQMTPRQKPITETRHLETGEMDGIEIDGSLEEELGLGQMTSEARRYEEEADEILMNQVMEQSEEVERRHEARADEEATIDGFFCPQGMSQNPRLYVDPDHEDAADREDEGRGESVDKPFRTIRAAIRHARQLTRHQPKPIHIRVMPGVYQEALTIPTRVMVVNHRMPSEGTHNSRVRWLLDQTDINARDRVTLYAPADAEDAVTFEPGASQGLFGVHVISREGTEQRGIHMTCNEDTVVMNCIIEGFSRGGVRIELSGSDLEMGGVQLLGCCIRRNSGSRGGGVRVAQSAMTCDGCLFEENVANRGGGLWANDLRAPLHLTNCEFRGNRAKSGDVPDLDPERIPPPEWPEQHGAGGGLWLGSSRAKLARCEFRDNGASVAGGGLALLDSEVILRGFKKHPLLFKGNRGRSGGGVFAVAPFSRRGLIRGAHLRFEQNLGKFAGGGMLLVGNVVAQIDDAVMEFNSSDKEEGLGGGAAIFNGAELIGTKLLFRSNRAGEGGAILARNATLRLKDHCIVQDNLAEFGRGAGIMVDTALDGYIEEMIGKGRYDLPFVIKLLDVEFVGNVAEEAPSALAMGCFHGQPRHTLGVEMGRSVDFRANRIQGTKGTTPSGQFQIMWREEERMNAETLRVGKVLLR